MKVSDIVKYAIQGELKTLSVGDIGTAATRTEKQEENLNTILGYIYQGLVVLHEEFPLSVSNEELYLFLNDTDPIQMPEYATYLYKATRRSDKSNVPINDLSYKEMYELDQYKGLYIITTSINTFTVEGNIVEGDIIDLVYAVAPKEIKYTDKIKLPFNFLEALLNYVAYKAHTSIKATPNTEQTNYLMLFNNSLNKLKENLDATYDPIQSDKFTSRGFV